MFSAASHTSLQLIPLCPARHRRFLLTSPHSRFRSVFCYPQDLQSERLRMKLLLRSGSDALAEADEEDAAAGKPAGGKGGRSGANPRDADLADPESTDRALVAALQAVAEARQESADLADGARTLSHHAFSATLSAQTL